MTGMQPTTLEDRLGLFAAAQLHGYPLLFLPDGDRDGRRPSGARRPGAGRRIVGLAGALAGRRRSAAVEPAPCPTC